jgi:crossover junction endodeoxyribonuclease RuvC
MIVIGIDPGTRELGYGVVAKEEGHLRFVACGNLSVPSQDPLSLRLEQLYDELQEIIQKYQPQALAVERPFFAKNARSAIKLGEVLGIVALAAAKEGVPLSEYSPGQVKGAVAGYGAAGKRQVQRMVKDLLGLDQVPSPPDAADALAVAICHHHTAKLKGLMKGETVIPR